MNKKIQFAKPKRSASQTSDANEWVEKRTPARQGSEQAEPMKRLTIDVPVSLHARVKAGCAIRGVKMADVMREFLDREFPTTKS